MFFGLICILLWGLIPVVSVLGMDGLDHYQFLFWSSLLSFITLLALTIFSRQTNHIKQQKLSGWLRMSLLGLLGTFFYYLCLYQGYQLGSKIEVLSVQYTWPAWVVVFALLVTKQRFRWHHTAVISSGIASVLLVISKGDLAQLSVPDMGVLGWVMFGAMGFALFSVLSGRTPMPPLPLNTIYFAVATVASFFFMMIDSSFTWPQMGSLGALLANGILVNGVSYYFWISALRHTKAEYLSLLTFLTPLVSVIYLVLLFDEPLYPAYFLAFGLVALSGALSVLQRSNIHEKKRQKKSA